LGVIGGFRVFVSGYLYLRKKLGRELVLLHGMVVLNFS